VVNEAGVILRANEKMAHLFSTSMEALCGTNIKELMRKEDEARIHHALTAAVGEKKEVVLELALPEAALKMGGDVTRHNWKMSVYSDAPTFVVIGMLALELLKSS